MNETVNEGRYAEKVFEENEKANTARRERTSRKTKLVDVRCACNVGKASVVYVRTEDQHANLLIKPLHMVNFYKHAMAVLKAV